ncbi:MAG: flagellar hook-length control-like protein [Desulfovibrio sp.]|nr:flagellar hook-length control-like protein [Desulfovibrio sp.]
MQNIPGIALEKATEQMKTLTYSNVKTTTQHQLFADLFNQHSNRIEDELALKPVATKEQVLEAAPVVSEEKHQPTSVANEEAPVQQAPEKPATEGRDRDKRMTQEDLNAVRDDLKQYGMTEEDIAEIEEEVNSEDGMTWGQFVSTIAHKMNEMRKVSLSDEQKDQLHTFFAKFGFTEKESTKLIKQLENGHQDKVMAALQQKIDQMPEQQQLLFSKEQIEAFSAAMNFSKEFTSKIKEAFGKNMMAKDMKEAFTMIRQEMANMDKKDQELVRAVGKTSLQAMGNTAKDSTAAKDLGEAVDLKPRVGEDQPRPDVKQEFREAADNRKDVLPDANARKSSQKVMPEQAQQDMTDQNMDNDSNSTWNNFFGKLQDDGSGQKGAPQIKATTETIESLLKTGLAEAQAADKARAWEKISAPKVMRQVENAFIQTMNNGAKQLTLQLTPEALGKLSVMLQVNGKEVSATIRAESADAAKVIAENIDIIKSSLESQGLKVDKLDVQTGLSGSNDYNNWAGQDQHNLAREREAMMAMRNHMRQMREESGVLAQDMQNVREQVINSDQRLYVVA